MMDFNMVENGYDKAQVDAYIVRVTEMYNQLYESHSQMEERCAELTSENQSLNALHDGQAQGAGALPMCPADPDIAVIGRVLVDAQKTAEDVIAKAKSKADGIVMDARISAQVSEMKIHEAVQAVESFYRTIKDITATLGGEI